ncbi:Hemicentin-2 [Halotydeus destructor]|nr:Hemicentin-2 [Halotydeus destructor]
MESPEILNMFSSLVVQEKEKFKIMCSLRKGSSPIEFSWSKDGTSLNRMEVKIANTQDMSILTIGEVKAMDAGNYTCKAQNSVGEDSKMVASLNVKQTPKWIKEPVDTFALIGDEITVECSASGSPVPTSIWYKLTDQSKQELHRGNQLKITQVNRRDEGLYECAVDSGGEAAFRKSFKIAVHVMLVKMAKMWLCPIFVYSVCLTLSIGGSSKVTNLKLRRALVEAPEFMKQLSDLKLQEGSKFTLTCSLSKGSSPVHFSWLKDKIPLSPSGYKIKSDQDALVTMLNFEKLKSSDVGNYTCEARNSAGFDSHTLQLIVKQTLKWQKEPKDVIAVTGQDVSVECSAIGSPAAVMTWFKVGQLRQKVSHGNYLKLNAIGNEAAGLYECQAENRVDDILRKTIRVSVTGTNPITFSWMKDNKPLYEERVKIMNIEALSMSTLAIDKLEPKDAGIYTCKAENSAGHDSHSLHLVIKQSLKWRTEPKDVTAGAGQDISIECSASGLPSPSITWYTLNQSQTKMSSTGDNLKFDGISATAAGLYECVASNGADQEIRKTIRVSVNGEHLAKGLGCLCGAETMTMKLVWSFLVVCMSLRLTKASLINSNSLKHRRALSQAPEIFKESSDLFKFREEAKLTLTCALSKGTSPVQFTWTKDGLPLEQHVKVRSIEDLSLSNLVIEKLKSSDAGNYTCKAQNAIGQDSHSLQLLIKQTPKWITEPQDVQAVVGQEISVECSASGSPTPLITWFRLNQPNKQNLSGSRLRLNAVSISSAGLYECRADNGVDEVLKKTVRLTVIEAESSSVKARREALEIPEITELLNKLELRKSQTFTFVCSLRQGTRPITFTWLMDGTSLSNAHAKVTNIGEMSILTIEKVLESDAGNYTCKAQNAAGHDSHTLLLIVKQIPRWLVEPQDVIGVIGRDIEVECSAAGSPTPVVTWFKVNQEKRTLFGSYLRLSQISDEAVGLYECVADNGVDEVLTKTVRLSVNDRKMAWSKCVIFLIVFSGSESYAESLRSRRETAEAPEISKQSNVLQQKENSKFTVMCSLIKGTNPVKFTWFKNNKPLNGEDVKIVNIEAISASSLTIENLKSRDAGNFTCKAENAAGQDSHSLHLTIKQTPSFVKQPQDVITSIGQDVTVECSATGSPMPVITWFKLSSPIRQKLQGNLMRLNQVSIGDSGMYECVADNGIDEVLKKTFRVSVTGKTFDCEPFQIGI